MMYLRIFWHHRLETFFLIFSGFPTPPTSPERAYPDPPGEELDDDSEVKFSHARPLYLDLPPEKAVSKY